MNKAFKQKFNFGFSLMEIIVAMAVFIFIFILGGNFIVTGLRTTTFGSEQEEAVYTARRAMEIMTKEIRGGNNSEKGDYPLSVIEDDNLVYYSDVEYDGETEKVRYFLDGTVLKRVITQPGPGNDYDQPGATTTLANYVNNSDIDTFTYYDSDYAETTDIDSVRLIKIKLKINVTPERAPNDYYLETDVHLRNLKDNL